MFVKEIVEDTVRENEKTFSLLMEASDTLASAVVLWFCPRIFGVGFSVPFCFLLTVGLGLLRGLFDYNSPQVSDGRYFKRMISCNALFFSLLAVASAILRGEESRMLMLYAMLASFLLQSSLSVLKRLVLFKLVRHTPSGRLLIFGDNAKGIADFVRELREGVSSLELVGAVGESLCSVGCPVLGGEDELYRIVARERITAVVLAMREYDGERLAAISARLDELYCTVYFLPVMYGLIKSSAQLEYFGATPLLRARASALDVRGFAFLKRLLDIVLSLLLIIITLPIMIFCAIGVKISLGSPIIFKQLRVGRYGREFKMYKFRSMREGESEGFDGACDTRRTRFGSFMRMTSLDELPQLINVLLGDMSLVGPRPEIPFYVESFRQEIPLYMLKHYVKPGITGLAQVKGLRGATSISERVKWDLFYIENWSLMLDIKILLMTPIKMINTNEKYNGDKDKK